ncbi:TatD family hydrolase [Micromonospora sp. NPDC047467]|uniref:TatD family hydrolase n=1 Tax=Micromonospora sp. NPDC047467 TaxID=3154814 RepID=UPI0033DC2D34
MSARQPALDMHAHIDPAIDPADLITLPGVVFAACRTLAESDTALRRRDARVIWGAGCHPGLARNHSSFDPGWFEQLVAQTPYVSEIGLDGSKANLPRQTATLDTILEILQQHPRLTSLHSTGAHDELLAALARRPIRGAILHWWLGTPDQTRRAVDLGCYFSMNHSAARRLSAIGEIPRERILPETDHPFGDRSAPPPRLPGNTASVETALAAHYRITPAQLRAVTWQNLSRLVTSTGCAALLNRTLITHLAAAG